MINNIYVKKMVIFQEKNLVRVRFIRNYFTIFNQIFLKEIRRYLIKFKINMIWNI